MVLGRYCIIVFIYVYEWWYYDIGLMKFWKMWFESDVMIEI